MFVERAGAELWPPLDPTACMCRGEWLGSAFIAGRRKHSPLIFGVWAVFAASLFVAATDAAPADAQTVFNAYQQAVIDDGATAYWTFDELPFEEVLTGLDTVYELGLMRSSVTPLDAGSSIILDTAREESFDVPLTAVSEPLVNPMNAVTLEVWFATVLDEERFITIAGGPGYGIGMGNGILSAYVGGGGFVSVPPAGLLNDGLFHHVVLTFDGFTASGEAVLELYVDGVSVAVETNPANGGIVYEDLELGEPAVSGPKLDRLTSTEPALVVDEIAIYPTALTAEQVAIHYGLATMPAVDPLGIGGVAPVPNEVIGWTDPLPVGLADCAVSASDVSQQVCFESGSARDAYLDSAGVLGAVSNGRMVLATHYLSPASSDSSIGVTNGPGSIAVVGSAACTEDVFLAGTSWNNTFASTRNGCAAVAHYDAYVNGPIGPPSIISGSSGQVLLTTSPGAAALGDMAGRTSAVIFLPVEPPTVPNDRDSINIVLMGDSYSAGHGAAGEKYGPSECLRRRDNWAERYVNTLRDSGLAVTFTNVACGGARTEHVLGAQVLNPVEVLVIVPISSDSSPTDREIRAELSEVEECRPGPNASLSYVVTSDLGGAGVSILVVECTITLAPQADVLDDRVDLVMFTFGGTDVGFSNIVTECVGFSKVTFDECKQLLDEADALLDEDEIRDRIEGVLTDIQDRTSPATEIVVVSYPYLERDEAVIIASGEEFIEWGSRIRGLGDLGDVRTREAIALADPGGQQITFVDAIKGSFAGREPRKGNDSGDTFIFGSRFGDGLEVIFTGLEFNELFHPKPAGHQAIADDVAEADTAAAAGPGFGTSSVATGLDVDLVFVVDTSASMGAELDEFAAIASNTFSLFRDGTRSLRMAVVSYGEGGGVGPPPTSQVELGFTSDPTEFVAAIAGLTAVGTGPEDASVDADFVALDLPWRTGVAKKLVIRVTDSESNPMATTEEREERAIRLDPVELHTLALSEAAADGTAVALAGGTNGAVVVAPTPQHTAVVLDGLLESIAGKPFAWINASESVVLGSSVTFDARGSFDPDGVIETYQWDFDEDGVFDVTTDQPVVEFTPAAGARFVVLRVWDNMGKSALGSKFMSVTVDGDSVPTVDDNCPTVPNPEQTDTDGDGLGDVCDDETVLYDPMSLPPVLVDDVMTVAAGETVTIDVLANDSDPDGFLLDPTLLIVGSTGPGQAEVVGEFFVDRQISFVAPNVSATTEIVYEVCDDAAICAQAVLSVETVAMSECTITGSEGADVLVGTAGPDIICGLGGNDDLSGLGGDDILFGGDGADILRGGGGADVLIGQKGADNIRGGAGADLVRGGRGADHLHGGAGDDVLRGGRGPDVLFGGAGDDRLYGGRGADELYGEEGSDTLRGRRGADWLDGGAGADTLRGGRGDDVLYGRGGPDWLRGGDGFDAGFGGAGTDVCDMAVETQVSCGP